MSRMSKVIASACVLALMLACLGGCAAKKAEEATTSEAETNTAGAAVGTPMYQVQTMQEVLDALKAPIFVPSNAQVVTYYIYNDEAGNPSFAEAQYLLGNSAYSQRMMPADSAMPELPGMFFEWTTTATVSVNDVEVTLSYNQDGPGQAVWYDGAYGVCNSVSMTSGATEDTLTQIVTDILSARI